MSTLTLSLLTAIAGAAEPVAGPAAESGAAPAAISSGAPATVPATAAPQSGVDAQYIDADVRPQDDFFRYLNGKWLQSAQIPADKSSWGSFAKLRDDTLPQLRGIIEAQQHQAHNKSGSEAQKIADLYASFMDEKQADTLGIRPLAGELSRIHSIKNKLAMPTLISHLSQLGVSMPYAVYVSPDPRESTKYAAAITQSGLGLPDRDYYLNKDDPKLAEALLKYQAHVEQTLSLAGAKDAAASAKAIVALETELAEAQWTKVALRDPVKRYNKVPIAKLAQLAPGYDWNNALATLGVGSKTDYVIVNQPSYLSAFSAILAKTDLPTLKAYCEWQLLRSASPYLSKDFVDANFAFYGSVITGVTEQPPRWKRGVGALESALGEAVGKLYVAQYFPPERKARMDALVNNLLAAYRDSIDQLAWMGPDTKLQAQAKLAKFTPKIAYPSKWRDYTALAILPNDLLGNMLRSAHFEYSYMVGKLGRPIDRAEWGMTPQTVNAYYNSTMNEIVFPAAILQPPFFSAEADDAVNYGAIGAVIGHEISHGFDDKGSQSDGDGNLRDWWTAQDRANFKARTDALVKQYDGYSPLPGHFVNGALTLGENIADNSGLAIAYKAYHLSLHGQPAPVIDGLTGDQRFYMGFAQVWRSKTREAQQLVLLKTDPHSPGQFRANGTLINQPGFYQAFDVKPGDRMYLAPEQRVILW